MGLQQFLKSTTRLIEMLLLISVKAALNEVKVVALLVIDSTANRN